MWWLDDESFEQNHESNWRLARGLRQAKIQIVKQARKRMTLLSAGEVEANKRLLEAGTSDDSLVPHPQKTSAHGPAKRTSVAEIKQLYDAQIEQLRGVAQEKVKALKHQLAKARHFIGDQAHDREFARVQLARLRRLLLEAEQKSTDRDQQLIEMQRELDANVAQAANHARDQQQIHENQCSYLTSVNSDVAQQAAKFEKETQKLRQYTQRLTATHRDQLNETRRKCRTELETLGERLANSQQECEQLREELIVGQERLEEWDLKREQYNQQIAALTQKCQIAEQIVRQTLRESEVRSQQDASTTQGSRAA